MYCVVGDSGGYWQRQRWQAEFRWIYRYIL